METNNFSMKVQFNTKYFEVGEIGYLSLYEII